MREPISSSDSSPLTQPSLGRILGAVTLFSLGFQTLAYGQVGGIASSEIRLGGIASNDPIANPAWKRSAVAQVRYSDWGDLRPVADRFRRSINPRGLITGEDVLAAVGRPAADYARFEQAMTARGESGDLREKYRSYLKDYLSGAIALLGLNRIIDNEAMKRGLPSDVTETRRDYVVRTILYENAVDLQDKVRVREIRVSRIPGVAPSQFRGEARPCGKDEQGRQNTDGVCTRRIPDEDMSVYSKETLYGWMKDWAVATATSRAGGPFQITFRIDWGYAFAGLRAHLDAMKTEERVDWPELALVYTCDPRAPRQCLPASAAEFERSVGEKLEQERVSWTRQAGWYALMEQFTSERSREESEKVSDAERAAYYEAYKDRSFSVDAVQSAIMDIAISGSRAKAFADRFNEVIKQRQERLAGELFPQGRQPGTEAEWSALKARLVATRPALVSEVLEQVSRESSRSIRTQAVVVATGRRTLDHNGVDPLPADDSIGSRQLRAAFDRVFDSLYLVPMLQLEDADGSIRIMVLVEQKSGARSYVGMNDPRVVARLTAQVRRKKQADLFRQVVYRAFQANRVDLLASFCSQEPWPCVSSGAADLTNAIFPEQLLPGQSLGADRRGQPIASSLESPELLSRVDTISTEIVTRAFELPNGPR